MDKRLEHFLSNLPADFANKERDAVHAFYSMLWYYALKHKAFGGDVPLEAWREAEPNNTFAHRSWRDASGNILDRARNDGWLRKIGKKKTTAVQSHIGEVAEWESLIFNTTDEGFELGH